MATRKQIEHLIFARQRKAEIKDEREKARERAAMNYALRKGISFEDALEKVKQIERAQADEAKAEREAEPHRLLLTDEDIDNWLASLKAGDEEGGATT